MKPQELFRTLFVDSNKEIYSFDNRKEGMMIGWQDNSRHRQKRKITCKINHSINDRCMVTNTSMFT